MGMGWQRIVAIAPLSSLRTALNAGAINPSGAAVLH